MHPDKTHQPLSRSWDAPPYDMPAIEESRALQALNPHPAFLPQPGEVLRTLAGCCHVSIFMVDSPAGMVSHLTKSAARERCNQCFRSLHKSRLPAEQAGLKSQTCLVLPVRRGLPSPRSRLDQGCRTSFASYNSSTSFHE